MRALSCLLVCAAAIPAAQGAPAGQPAVWVPHDMIVDLTNLPRRYSCDDLWYKFRDVLLELGARPDMRILAYRCEAALGPRARSPSVHLRFDLPSPVDRAQARWADVTVTSTTVRIAPGHPASIDGRDCTLLKQMKSGLLDPLAVKVTTFDLACAAPQRQSPRFGISAQALTPIDTGHRQAAAPTRGGSGAAGPITSGRG